MSLPPLSAVAILVAAGIGAEWLANRLQIPSIALLLGAGFLVGPGTGLVNPDPIFGDALFPIVSLAVAVILFEGGLRLRLAELRPVLGPVLLLTTLGVTVTWISTGLLAWFLLGFHLEVALLLGAILVVTGPTVIIPLFRNLDAEDRVETIAMWEGIVNDPLGAVLAISVYELAVSHQTGPALADASMTLLFTIATGIVAAAVGAALLIQSMDRGWVPAYLETPVTLAVVVGGFAAAESVTPEAGLIASTLMGIVVANQSRVDVERIVEFKETLGVILVSVLFVTLAARFELEGFQTITLESCLLLAALVLLVRPISVLVSGLPAGLSLREIAAIGGVAPRGIVAAALGSLFALKLVEAGYPEARQLDAEVFFLIAGTVLVYSLLAAPLFRLLGFTEPDED